MNKASMSVCVLVGTVIAGCALADTITRGWRSSATVGALFTDNRDGTENNKESNIDVTAEPRLDYLFRLDQGELDLFVSPGVKWHSNPRTTQDGDPQNDADFYGSGGFDASYQIVPRLGIKFGDTLIYADDPSIDEGGATVRQSAEHFLNTAYGLLDAEIKPKVRADLLGSVVTKRYTEDVVADSEDEDILVGRGDVKYLMGPDFTVSCFAGVSDFNNETPSNIMKRGSTVYDFGVGAEKAFTPDFTAKVSAGYDHATYDNGDFNDLDTMSGKGEVVLRAASATRFRLAGMYGFYAPYVRPYSVQKLTSVTGSVDHDLTSQIMLALTGQYTDGEYESEGPEAPGGNDKLTTVGLHGSYRINRNLSAGVGYSFEHWDSDVRESFDRNNVDVSLRAEL